MSKNNQARREHEITPLHEKPEPIGFSKPKATPKQCWRCKGWMDIKATECPYCSLPMGKS
jgi:hypothetical protein